MSMQIAMHRIPSVVAALMAAAGIALSAYAAHAPLDAEGARRVGNAALFLLVQGVAGSVLLPQASGSGERGAILLQIAGCLVFSISLVAKQWLGWPSTLAPAGGMAMIAGWLWLAVRRMWS
ncbi:DUF423 domain-containing protein [Solilutibacter silvestris]|uniref:DUF423 domain-containing protein n=1 Tax=Solilutibacter silvestris TaxID=1645665 RepID=A0A2K1Q3X2_9GAMM|nr:DUF423 domain-containing protein [Lysobacter silvestris]PNS09713.1 hypothetical protein Lysil_1342 [Lysobacter silvestris]